MSGVFATRRFTAGVIAAITLFAGAHAAQAALLSPSV